MEVVMKAITREVLKNLSADIDKALEPIGEKYGISLKCGKAKFSDDSADITVSAAILATKDYDPARERWKKNVRFTGLTEEDFGKTIFLDGKPYTICDFKSSARKNSIVVRNEAGASYVTDIETVLKALNRNRLGGSEDRLAEAMCNRNAVALGLNICYGQEIRWQGQRFKVVEINLRAPKWPIIAVDMATGNRYKLPRSAGQMQSDNGEQS